VGKHWEFDSDSETEELQLQQTLPPVKKKKLPKKAPPKKVASSETDAKRKKKSVQVEESDDEEAKEKEKEKEKPKPPKQLPKKRKTAFTEELIGDYKGILARKRMASLNASAIVAATYEVERHLDKNLASDCSSFESYDELDTMPTTTSKVTSAAAIKTEVIHIKKEPKESKESLRERERERESERRRERDNELKDSTVGKMSSHSIIEESNDSKYSKETKETNTDTTITTTGYRDSAASTKDAKDCSRPTSSSVVIVQDTDVTITGVYVNASNGAAQEAYCKMQYRVQSSVTEERVLRPGSVEPPKSYTPLSALSSMLPPGASSGLSEGKSN